MTSLSTALVQLCCRPIAPEDRESASLLFLDWLGIVFATRGSDAERGFGKAAGFPDGALSTFARLREQPEQAAFALGALGSLLEMDDLHRRSILHAGDVVCPAGLSAAMASNASGLEFLNALIVGYEAGLRIGSAAASGGYTAWYNSASCGVFAAAMAAGRANKLSAHAQAAALGHAGMQASGLWQCRLEDGYAKQLATAHAARAGLSSAFAARAGLEAPRKILEGELGFFPTFYPDASAKDILFDGEGRWLLHDVSTKPWSACRHTHPAISAALKLTEAGHLRHPIRSVEVSTYQAAVDFCDNAHPKTAHAARFSLQHCVAVALLRGAPKRADFEDTKLRNSPELAELRSRISLSVDLQRTQNFPDAYSAAVSLVDCEGRPSAAEAPHAPGDPEAPASKTQIIDKFVTNCTYVGLPNDLALQLVEQVRGLSQAKDLSQLSATLTAATNLGKQ